MVSCHSSLLLITLHLSSSFRHPLILPRILYPQPSRPSPVCCSTTKPLFFATSTIPSPLLPSPLSLPPTLSPRLHPSHPLILPLSPPLPPTPSPSLSLPPMLSSLHPSLLYCSQPTSPELWGIQDRQVAVVTGRSGICLIYQRWEGGREHLRRKEGKRGRGMLKSINKHLVEMCQGLSVLGLHRYDKA